MTNTEKQELRRLVLQGKSFAEIRRVVGCSDATIRQYIKVFSGKDINRTPANPEGTELACGIDTAVPNGDETALSTRIDDTLYTFVGKEASAILQWHTTLVEQAVLEARIQELEECWNNGIRNNSLELEDAYLTERIGMLKVFKSQQAGKETDT